MDDVFEGTFRVSPEIVQEVASITGVADTESQTVAALTTWVAAFLGMGIPFADIERRVGWTDGKKIVLAEGSWHPMRVVEGQELSVQAQVTELARGKGERMGEYTRLTLAFSGSRRDEPAAFFVTHTEFFGR